MELINAVFEYGYSIQMIVLIGFAVAFGISQLKATHK